MQQAVSEDYNEGKHIKVLAMAGTQTERSLISSALQKGMHEVLFAESVEQALKLIEANGVHFVIIDDQPDGRQGSELISLVRAFAESAVYFLTLTSANEDAPDSDDSLRKPFTISKLSARICAAFSCVRGKPFTSS